MIDNEDWQAAYREVLAQERAKGGEPPTVEEIEACFAGKLTEEQAAPIVECLAYYPELARVMTTPFPDDSNDVLSDETVEHDWQRLRNEIGIPDAGGCFRWYVPVFAIAASVAIVLALLYFWRSPIESLDTSGVVARVMVPDGQRSSGELPILLKRGDRFDLQLALPARGGNGHYRIEIEALDQSSRRTVWNQSNLTRAKNGGVAVSVPGSVLTPGSYEIRLYHANEDEAITRYTVTVPGS